MGLLWTGIWTFVTKSSSYFHNNHGDIKTRKFNIDKNKTT